VGLDLVVVHVLVLDVVVVADLGERGMVEHLVELDVLERDVLEFDLVELDVVELHELELHHLELREETTWAAFPDR
jgi:hypothetical protein